MRYRECASDGRDSNRGHHNARYLRRPPDTASIEDLRNYQLHLVDSGTSPISLTAAITGLKFFFGVTAGTVALSLWLLVNAAQQLR